MQDTMIHYGLDMQLCSILQDTRNQGLANLEDRQASTASATVRKTHSFPILSTKCASLSL